MQYIAYDDEGIIKVGTKQECLKSIIDLVEDGELDNVYNSDDLDNIFRYFSRKFEDDEEIISYYGFTIKEVKKEN